MLNLESLKTIFNIERTFIHNMKNSKEKRDSSIERIVNVSLKLFAEKGYDTTSIRAIAQEAGISLGLMYNYFKSKDELLKEIFTRGSQDIHTSFSKDTGETNSTSIENHIRKTVKLLKEKREFWKLLHGIRMQSPVIQKLLLEMKEETGYIEEQIKQNLIEAGISFPDLEAKLLFASIDGMANHYLFYDNYPIDDVATLLIMKYKK